MVHKVASKEEFTAAIGKVSVEFYAETIDHYYD